MHCRLSFWIAANSYAKNRDHLRQRIKQKCYRILSNVCSGRLIVVQQKKKQKKEQPQPVQSHTLKYTLKPNGVIRK